MAWAVCRQCGIEQQWGARRGARLADLQCGRCGGRLHARPIVRRTNAGQTYARCERCGRKRLRRKLVQVRWPWVLFGGDRLRVGMWVCWSHDLECPRGRTEPDAYHLTLSVARAEAGHACAACEGVREVVGA